MKYNWLRLAVLLMFSVLIPETFRIPAALVMTAYWFYNIESRYWFLIAVIFCGSFSSLLFPENTGLSGRVRYLNENYFVINSTVVYYDLCSSDITYDDYVTVKAEGLEPITDHLSFHAFSFSEYYRTLNAEYCCFPDEVILVSKSGTMRARLYRYVSGIANVRVRSFYRLMLFNLESSENDYIMVNGFYFSGVFFILSYILKWFIDYRYLKYVNFLISLAFALLYHFPLTLLRLSLKNILLLTDMNAKDRLGILIIVLLIYNRSFIFSLGFVFPVSFYFINVFHREEKMLYFLNSMLVQSVCTYGFHLFRIFLFRYLMRILGLVYLAAIVFLLKPECSIPLSRFLDSLDALMALDPEITGKPGIIVYVLLIMLFIGIRWQRNTIMVILYVLMMAVNISHPLASVSFINVGQGDSILLRLPYNSANILIDTGKESSYLYLDSYLRAMGVSRIDYLILTHDDSDHNGSRERLEADYDVIQVIEEDTDINIGRFRMLSLNPQGLDNDNDNSLVYWFEINGISFLMTGDISRGVERDLIRKYSGLECDVLKLSHHGSRTGSDPEFIKQLNPWLAVISSGETYHHPHQETLDTMRENHIFSLQTRKKGDIVIFFTGIVNILGDSGGDFAIISNRW